MREYNPNNKTRKIVLGNIHYYREKANISQEDLSLKLGRKKDFVERLENNKTKVEPTIDLMDNIAKILNIPTISLVKERKQENEWDGNRYFI